MIGLKDVESHQTIPTRSFISWQVFACDAFIILCSLELPRLSHQCINMGRGQRCPALCSTAAPPSPSASLAWCSVHISEQLAGSSHGPHPSISTLLLMSSLGVSSRVSSPAFCGWLSGRGLGLGQSGWSSSGCEWGRGWIRGRGRGRVRRSGAFRAEWLPLERERERKKSFIDP